MALRQTMNLSQNLVITPQLQQAIKLLQMSRLELESQVRNELEENPILEEAWQIKDQLAAEAGNDVDRFFENLRKWEAEHPHTGPVVGNADELRQLVAQKERQRAEDSAMALNDQPQRKKD